MREIELTQRAKALLSKMRLEHPNLVLLIDDSSCCSNSNIMVREEKPNWPVTLLCNKDGVRVYLNPILEKSLEVSKMIIDALDFTDDSFSLETEYGKRLIMSTI